MSMFDLAAERVAAGADPHAEAGSIVDAMTDDELLGCLDGDTPFWPGFIDMTSGGYYQHPWPAARVERLGVPGIEFADGPRGCVVGRATAFPVPMARGATFDPALEEEVGAAIGAELRASGATLTGAVCMNLLRHPAWGRAQETYGEDPVHVGEMAAASTRGLQRHVLACMKHYALNSMENSRFKVDVQADERTLHEVYLPHFRRVAAEGVASTMSAYNSVNGSWCGEHRELLTDVLRGEWGWDGFVISDFVFGLRDAVASVGAGLDIEMPFRQVRAMHLPDALASGALDRLDARAAATRIVATLLRFAPLLDPARAPSPEVIAGPDHRALARRVSAASMVLLQDRDGLLPLDPTAIGQVAVIGRLADVANLGDGGSSDVHPPEVVTPLAGIRAALPGAEVLHLDASGLVAGDASSLVDVEARAALAAADVAVVVVGYTKLEEGEFLGLDESTTAPLAAALFPPPDHPELGLASTGGTASTSASAERGGSDPMARGGDRASLRLTGADEALIEAVAAVHDRVVVAVMAGSAVVMPWADRVGAVLMLWYPGMEGGAALGDVLTGVEEPGGRLPFAVPHDEADLVPFDRDASTAEYGLLHGQWWLDHHGVAAHFPFGSGSGYTTWEVVGAALTPRPTSPAIADPTGDRSGVAAEVAVDVRNTGGRDGSTVLFAFASLPDSDVARPPERLVGFVRVHVQAGGSARVVLPIDLASLDVRVDGRWRREPGDYVVRVGRRAGDPQAVELTVPVTAP